VNNSSGQPDGYKPTAATNLHVPTSPTSNGPPRNKPELLGDLDAARWALRVAESREPPPPDVARRLPPEWGDACLLAEDDGQAGLDAWLKAERIRLRGNLPRYEAIVQALAAARLEGPDTDPAEPESDKPKRFRLKVLGAREFAATEFKMEWRIRRVLVADQPCVVAAPKKGMKTTVMADMAVSAASGTHFLGAFEVALPVPVLLLSGESGGFVLKDTIRRVCRSKGINLEDLEGNLFVGFELPQLSIEEQVDVLAELIREHGIKIVIVDPLYLCLLSGGHRRLDPSNLFDMGPLLQGIAKKSLEAGATPVLVHHFRKNLVDPHELPEMDSMAYAGIQEFARQWILLGRREKFVPGTSLHKLWLTVGGSAGHSGEWAVDVDEGIMGDDFQGREWGVSVRPASEARVEATEQSKSKKVEKEKEKETSKEQQEREAMGRALDRFRQAPDHRLSTNALQMATGWNPAKVKRILFLLVEHNHTRPTSYTVQIGNGASKSVNGFELIPDGGALQ
jgi:hypothetical protein